MNETILKIFKNIIEQEVDLIKIPSNSMVYF